MAWIKKQWKKLTGIIIALAAGGIVVFNNGQKVEMTHYKGVHLLEPTFGAVYANNGQQIPLKKGERFISIGIVLAGDSIVTAFADTLDATVDMGVIAKFTQCKK